MYFDLSSVQESVTTLSAIERKKNRKIERERKKWQIVGQAQDQDIMLLLFAI